MSAVLKEGRVTILRILALGAMTTFGLTGVALAADSDGAFASDFLHFGEKDGQAMYVHVCAGCHMPNAKGAVGAGAYPALAGNANLATAGYPVAMVLHGQKAMPAVGEMMTDQQVADVVNYVRTHFGNDYKDRVTAAEVKAAR